MTFSTTEQLAEQLADQASIARRLKVKEKTLEAWRHRGGGPPFVRVGRLVRYRPSAVESWIRSRERRSTSDHGDSDISSQ